MAHMSPHRDDLIGYKKTFASSVNVTVANGKTLRVAGEGKILVKYTEGKRKHVAGALQITGGINDCSPSANWLTGA